MVARFGRPNVTCPVSSARVTRSCRSSTRLQPWPRGGFLRGCPTASPQLAGGQFSFASLFGLVAAVLYAGEAPIGPASFFAALAVAIGFGPITSDVALGQIALPAFLGAVLVAIHRRTLAAGRNDLRLRGVRAAEPRTRTARSAFARPRRARASRSPRRLLTRSACFTTGTRGRSNTPARSSRTARPNDSRQSKLPAFSIARSFGTTPPSGVAGRGRRCRSCDRSGSADHPPHRQPVRALRGAFGLGAFRCRLRARTRSRRCISGRDLVRVSNARNGPRARARRNAVGLRRLARPRAAAERYRAERAARNGSVRSIWCSRAAFAAA